MRLFSEKFINFFNKNIYQKSNFIFYKIIEFSLKNYQYKLQCINTKVIFHAKINDIVCDTNILHRLHPTQACFIGIEYAQYLKMHPYQTQLVKNQKLNKSSINKCTYELHYQDRNGNICFINRNTSEARLMKPRDIAFSKALIEKFEASQAFYIGLLAGLKMNRQTQEFETSKKSKHPYLRIVK